MEVEEQIAETYVAIIESGDFPDFFDLVEERYPNFLSVVIDGWKEWERTGYFEIPAVDYDNRPAAILAAMALRALGLGEIGTNAARRLFGMAHDAL